ncbi:MAG: NAD(P)-dependent oxidoreductase [Halobacteriaceae archaeon]
MQVTVIGGDEPLGERIVDVGLSRGHNIKALLPAGSDLSTEDDNMSVIDGTVMDPNAVNNAIRGSDAVVVGLDHAASDLFDILSTGNQHVLAAMKSKGIDRYVTAVGAFIQIDEDKASIKRKSTGVFLDAFAPEQLVDVKNFVEDIVTSNMAWTIVRTPRLTGEGHGGDYRVVDPDALPFSSISRMSVASFILDCIENDQYRGEAPCLAPAGP